MKKNTSRSETVPTTTQNSTPSSANVAKMGYKFISLNVYWLINEFYEKLCADNARDFYRPARRDRPAFFIARRGRVTRAGLLIRNFTHAVVRDGRNDGRRLAYQFGHARFRRAFRLAEHPVEKPQEDQRNHKPGFQGDGRANPNAARRV